MFSLPSLPTANIYVFVTALGGVLFGYGFLGPFHVKDQQDDRVTRVVNESDDRFRKNSVLLLRFVEADPTLTDDAKRQAALVERTQQLVEFEERIKGPAIERINQKTERKLGYLFYARVVGGVMAFTGFVLWYLRVQRPTDRLLQTDLAKSSVRPVRISGFACKR